MNEDPGQHYQLESLEIELLLTGIARHYGYDFRSYARASLTRRIRHVMLKEGVDSVGMLQARVLRDPACMARFVEALAVHTTSMFRDPAFYLALRQEVVPLLRTYPFARIWLAGCATGEEVYSVAIVLHEEGLLDRCRLYATDLSDRAVEHAGRGIYPLALMREYTLAYQRSGGRADFSQYYATDEKNAIFRGWIRKNVIFSQHNLASDGAFNEFHLVLCRNVTIYFDKELRDRVHDIIYNSLIKFGLLGLGMRETIQYTPHENCYQELAGDVRLYRRVV